MTLSLLERCREPALRYAAIEMELQQPDTVADAARYLARMREYRALAPIADAYAAYTEAQKTMTEAKLLLDEAEADGDDGLSALAREELTHANETVERLERELTVLLLPRDEDDDRSVIMEIRAGAGGEEAALFAANLYRMYRMYAEHAGWSISVVSINDTELGGIKEISFFVEGTGAFSRFKYESGVHRVQRVPETESQGRIQTSTATVAVLPEIEDVEIDIPPSDIKMESCKSSGAGGQHINKTESAVRITHLPTGIVVECQEERSQFKNRDKAMKMLKAKLYEMEKTKRDTERADARKSQIGSGDRSEKIRTYNFPQRRVTDHRIGLTLYTLEDILNGDLDAVIGPLTEADIARKLEESEEHA
ncbi:MAG: peptide chain release factor 1 [Clostridia bacterium]|nr:peptide chain release factor 1 [Clostridia bacterium]